MDQSPAQVQSQLMQVEPHSSSTVIELSSKGEFARHIESLHVQFTGLVTKIRIRFNELVSNEKLKAAMVAIYLEEYLGVVLSKINIDTIFNAIEPHYSFLYFDLIKELVGIFIPSSDDIHTELTQYIDSVDKFSESSQLKHILSSIKKKLSSLPAAASPTDIIKLTDGWNRAKVSKLEAVLNYFEVAFSHISFDNGSGGEMSWYYTINCNILYRYS